MLTSFQSDDARVRKQLEMLTYSGQYALNVPGPGIQMPFLENVHCRLQKWGANYDANKALDIDNELRGITRKYTRDGTQYKVNHRIQPRHGNVMYRSKEPFTKESRASDPAYEFRDQDAKYDRFEQLWIDPQARGHWEKDFKCNVNSKQEARDTFLK